MILANHGIVSSSGGVLYDADAQAFMTAAAITDNTQKTAVNTLVTDFKSANIWTKMIALYPFMGGSATSHKYNLKDPRDLTDAYRLDFFGGWTHTSNGVVPNGTTAYADTNLIPNSAQSVNSNGFGVYLKTLNTSSASEPYFIGCYNSNTQNSLLGVNSANTNISFSLNGATRFANDTPLGLIHSYRTSSTDISLYRNQNNISNQSTSGTLPINSMFLGTIRLNNGLPYSVAYVNSIYSFAFISNGLSDTEASNLYTAVQAYQTTLNRQV